MKRKIAICIAAIMAAALIYVPVMADGEDLAGTWYAQSMEQDGSIIDGSVMAAMGMSVTLTLNEDGTAALSMADQENTCTWEGTSLIMEDHTVPMEVADGTLTIDQNGAKMVFTKEPPKAADTSLAPVIENPELSDFDGTWNAVTYYAFGLPLPIKISMGSDFTMVIKEGNVAYTERIYDLNNNSKLTETIEKEFTAKLDENGTLFVDFNGEEVLKNVVPGSSGIRLTLHEGDTLSGEIPELTETMEMIAAMSQGDENSEAETAEGSSDGSSSGDMEMSAYIIFEKAE